MRGQTKEHTHLTSSRETCHLTSANQAPNRLPYRNAFMNVQALPWAPNRSLRDCIKYLLGDLGGSVDPFLYIFKIVLNFIFPMPLCLKKNSIELQLTYNNLNPF